MNNNNAVILLFLSEYRNSLEVTYTDDQQLTYSGTQTNDAPLKYLVHHIQEKNLNLSKVLCITSKKVKQDKINASETAIDRYKHLVYETYGQDVDFYEIAYDYKIENNEILPVDNLDYRAFHIYDQIKNIDLSHSNIFVDYTGGLRDISYLMTSLIRYFEFTGIKCQKVIYSNFQNRSINDISYIYEMYQMISGTSEFISYGNAKQLQELFQDDHDPIINNVINSIVDFSNTLSLCDVGKIDKSIKNVVKSIEQFEKCQYNDIKHASLQYLVPTIKEKMYLNDIITNHDINYPFLIRWCIDHNLLQQAITLYIEKMPKYYLNSQIFPKELIKNDSSKNDAEIFYRIYDNITEKFDIVSRNISQFLHMLNSINFEHCRTKTDYLNALNNNHGQIKINSLKSFINDKFDMNGKKYNKKYYIYGEIVKEKNIKSFINNLKNQNKLVHYFLYNNSHSYEQFDKSNKSSTYKKKTIGLQYLIQNEMENKDLILDILAYYLSFKFIRNRMNHASEKELDENELYLIQFIESLQLSCHNTISLDTSFENIKKILYEAIQII